MIVTVDADYFVSGYEPAKLGEHGVLGLLGADGVFRVRRSGDSVVSGDTIDYATAVAGADADETDATVTTSGWDGVQALDQCPRTLWLSARRTGGTVGR